MLHAGGRQHDPVQVPPVGRSGQPAPDLVRERLAELERPLARVDPLRGSTVADEDTARGQQLVHHMQAERGAKVEPDGVAE